MDYTEGRSHRLKREEDKDRNHDKKAIAAESWYLVHNFPMQKPSEASKRLLTLAVEQDAASDRNERTYQRIHQLLICYCSVTISDATNGKYICRAKIKCV